MIERHKQVRAKLKKLAGQARKDDGVGAVAGFSMAYATYVHEAPMTLKGQERPGGKGKFWDPQGIATNKFLERPFRTNGDRIVNTVAQTYKQTKNLQAAFIQGALLLQRLSQELTPRETGALRASAFVATLKDITEQAEAARARGEALRKGANK